MTGTLYGIGVGPGDPELITLKGHRLLQSVPVIAWPAPLEGDSMARRIAAPHLPEGRIEIPIRMPLSSDRFPVEGVYDQAAEALGAHLSAGRDVAVLCEGDPFVYGSFMYLFARMADRFLVTVVPGISSLTAGAAALGAPLAARNDVLSVVPAPLPEEALEQRLAAADAAVIIKIGRHLGKLRRVLRRLDLVERARYVEYATMAEQNVRPFAEVSGGEAPYFSMVVLHRRGDAWR
ncbi:MAG: precorrin-2 C(20)-methyltransferase [Alphaproteobacteria bacterium]|nr:precorrin-2 C(20)-methyltransferase [Alphaproteobacteria bacterium]